MTKLVAGKVSDPHFLALIDATRLSSEKVISALFDHLVLGKKKSVAMKAYGVDISFFSRRLARLQQASDIAEKLAPFYPMPGTPSNTGASSE
jgi:hypothetical protein